MADKKISQFEDFYGSGDSFTYFVVASGLSTDVNARNYKWDFKTLSRELKDEMFGGIYPFSGNDEALHIGLFDREDARDLRFDIGGDTKMYIASGEGMYIKDDLRVSGDAYLMEKTYVDEIYGNSGFFTLLESDYSVALDLKSVTGCFSDSIIVGGNHFNEYYNSCDNKKYRQYINAALNGSHSGLFIDCKTRDVAEVNVPLLRIDGGIASNNETFFWANSAGNLHLGSGAAPTGKLNISYADGIQFLIDDFQSGQFIVKDGLVGVHTENPSTELHVYAGDQAPIFLQRPISDSESTVGVSFNFGNSSNIQANKPYAYIGGLIEDGLNNAEDGALVFHTTLNNNSAGINDTTERVRITSLGRVGVREQTPTSWLDITTNDGELDGGQGIRVKNQSEDIEFKLELGTFDESYLGLTSNNDFHIKTNDVERISIAKDGMVAVNNNIPGPTSAGGIAQFQVNGGHSFLDEFLVVNGLTVTPHIFLRGAESTSPTQARILTDLDDTQIGTSTDGSTIPNPITIDSLGGITFGELFGTETISPGLLSSVASRNSGTDIYLRNQQGTSHQKFTLVDGTANTIAGFSFELSGDSGANWNEFFNGSVSELLWNGDQLARLIDIKDGTLTIQNQSGTNLGSFTANQDGDSTVTVPDPANDGTLSIVSSTGTNIATFTANSSTDVTATIPDPPAPGNGTLSFVDGSGTAVGSFTANQSTDTQITLSASVDIATATDAGIVKPGDGLSVAADGTLSIANWNNSLEPSLFTSDSRLKNNLKSLNNSVDTISKISGYEFTWSDDAPFELSGKRDIGVLAQDVEKVLPNAVGSDDEGNLAVAYHKLIPVLIEAVKEQQREINSLKNKIELLRKSS